MQQSTILKEDLAGFIFEYNRGTKHSFTAETSLGPEFATGWGGKKNRKMRSKTEEIRTKVLSLSCLQAVLLNLFLFMTATLSKDDM